MSRRSTFRRSRTPAARRGHRSEPRDDPPFLAPFARVNQDCVDIVVGYAACSVDAVLQLRRVSRGVAAGVVNHFALVYRRAGHQDCNPHVFTNSRCPIKPIVTCFDRLDLRAGTSESHVFLEALYCNAPSAAEYDTIHLGYFGSDTLVCSMVFRYPRITELDCGIHHPLGDAALQAIADKCTALRTLRLSVDSPGASLSALRAIFVKCPTLNRFGLRQSQGFVSSTLESIGKYCAQLATVELIGFIGQVWDPNLSNAARHFGNLTELRLTFHDDRGIDDAAIAFAENCPHLKIVSVAGSNVTDAALVTLAYNCPGLQALDVSTRHSSALRSHVSSAYVTAAGVNAIARHCPQLTELDLSGTKVDSKALQALVSGWCCSLRVLHIGVAEACVRDDPPADIDVGSITALLRACTRLTTLTVGTGAIADADIAKLHRTFPECKISVRT